MNKTREHLIKEIQETLPLKYKCHSLEECNQYLKEHPNESFIVISKEINTINNDITLH